MSETAAPTFVELWSSAVATGRDRTFLRFEAPDGAITEWTYGEFDDVVDDVVTRFAAAGVGRDAGVHLALTNSPSFVAAWLAAARLGSYIVPSDPGSTAPELVEHASRTSPAIGLCGSARADVYRAAAAEIDGLQVVEVDESVGAPLWLGADTPRADSGADLPGPPDSDDRLSVMFTSGTTGRPKGVVVTQANYAFAGTAMAAAAGLGADDRQLVVLPLFHANAQYYSFASAIAVGASVALMHAFSASRFVTQAARHAATHASLFAGPIRMILARGEPLPDGEPPLQLRHCWFAQNLTGDQFETFATWIGCQPRQLYGMTETIPAVLTDTTDDPRPDSMGTVTAGCRLEIHDDAGDPCPDDTIGEIVVAGRPGIELFDGYLDDPATTAAAYRGDWFRTGDRAWRDTDGRYHFDGRRADVLKVSGENVSVVEVEAALAAHPGVHEVVVVGAPDPIRDEVPVAFVVPTADANTVTDVDALPAELDAWSTERLSKAKRPHRYVVVDDLPRTSVGKIRKFLLAGAAAEGNSPADQPDTPPTTPENRP